MPRRSVYVLLPALLLVLVGLRCSTIYYCTTGRTRVISFASHPDSAEVTEGRAVIGVTPFSLRLRDTVEGIYPITDERYFTFRKKGYAPKQHTIGQQQLMAPAFACCGCATGVVVPVLLVWGSRYERMDHIEGQLPTWPEFAKALTRKLRSRRSAQRFDAMQGFSVFDADAGTAIPFLLDSFPVLSDIQRFPLSTEIDNWRIYATWLNNNSGTRLFSPSAEEKRSKRDGGLQDIRSEDAVRHLRGAWGDYMVIHNWRPGPISHRSEFRSNPYTLELEVQDQATPTYDVDFTVHLGAFALMSITGQDLGTDRESWLKWWSANRTKYETQK